MLFIPEIPERLPSGQLGSAPTALTDTNIVRKQYGSPSVGWDATAAAYAQKVCNHTATHPEESNNITQLQFNKPSGPASHNVHAKPSLLTQPRLHEQVDGAPCPGSHAAQRGSFVLC